MSNSYPFLSIVDGLMNTGLSLDNFKEISTLSVSAYNPFMPNQMPYSNRILSSQQSDKVLFRETQLSFVPHVCSGVTENKNTIIINPSPMSFQAPRYSYTLFPISAFGSVCLLASFLLLLLLFIHHCLCYLSL